MKTRKREIAKVGIFGSIDNPTIVTEKDLKEISETFSDQKTAPIQFGHWANSESPRLGNVVSVTYDPKAQSLSAEIEEHDALFQAVEDGFYPDVSIGAKQRASDGKMYLHHLAYLGEEAPAIKDLKGDIAESLETVGGIAASDSHSLYSFPSVNAKRLYLSDKPIYKEIKTGLGATPEGPPLPSEQGPKSQSKTQEESSMTTEEEKALKEELARLSLENEQKEKMLADSVKAQREAQKEILQKAVAGKLSEPETELLMQLSDSFNTEKKILLSDTRKEENPILVLASLFANMSRKVEPGTINLSDDSTARDVPGIAFNRI